MRITNHELEQFRLSFSGCASRDVAPSNEKKAAFYITAEILAHPLVDFHCQLANIHMNL